MGARLSSELTLWIGLMALLCITVIWIFKKSGKESVQSKPLPYPIDSIYRPTKRQEIIEDSIPANASSERMVIKPSKAEGFVNFSNLRVAAIASRASRTTQTTNLPRAGGLGTPTRATTRTNATFTQEPVTNACESMVRNARRIRVAPNATGDGVITFSQLMVFDDTGTNIAFEKPVTVSGASADPQRPPSLIVNGDITGSNYWISSPGNTNTNAIEVDLVSPSNILYVLFVNRQGPEKERSAGARLILTDTVGTVREVPTHLTNEDYQVISFCNESTSVRYVVVRPPLEGGDGGLRIRQIQVNDSLNAPLHRGSRAFSYKGGTTASPFSADGSLFTPPPLDAEGDARAAAVINGDFRGTGEAWQSATKSRDKDYWAIDLGADRLVSTVALYGALGGGADQTPISFKGVRVELYTNSGSKMGSFVLQDDTQIQILTVLNSVDQVTYNKSASPFDSFYDAYQEQQYDEPFALQTEITREVNPDWGAQLKNFDAQLQEIPWDAENKDYQKQDVLWGAVSPIASMGLYNKVYAQNLADEAAYFEGENQQPAFKSAILNQCVYDPRMTGLASFGEMLSTSVAGQVLEEGMEYGIERTYQKKMNNYLKQMAEKAGVRTADDYAKFLNRLNNGEVAQKAKRLLSGRIKFRSPVNIGIKRMAISFLNKVGFIRLIKSIAGPLKRLGRVIATKIAAKLATWTAIKAAGYGIGAGFTTAATAVCAGTLGLGCAAVAWMFVTASAIFTVLGVMDIVLMAITPVINLILSRGGNENGVCQEGSETLEARVGKAGKWVIVNLLPGVGTIFDLLDPYFCFDSKGLPVNRLPVKNPAYRYDKTLSIYYRDFGNLEPRASQGSDPGFALPNDINEMSTKHNIQYCDYSKPEMLDRMALFYNEKARKNPTVLEDGRIEYKIITKIKGIVASSELSADMRCEMVTLRHDPITGENLEKEVGCSYPDDETMQGVTDCFRRFYFVKMPEDPVGIFTVTGCTHEDYTALDAMVQSLSTEEGSPYVPGLPKVYKVNERKQRGYYSSGRLQEDLLTNILPLAAGMGSGLGASALLSRRGKSVRGGSFISSGTGLLAGVGAGFGAQQAIQSESWRRKWQSGEQVDTDYKIVPPSGNKSFNSLVVDTPDYNIDYGPIVEESSGYIPRFISCSTLKMYDAFCADKAIVKSFVEGYQTAYPTKHIREITGIESRGTNGCYYKFKEVNYNTDTNEESGAEVPTDIVMVMEQPDPLTCIYVPKEFTKDYTNYPLTVVKDYKYIESAREEITNLDPNPGDCSPGKSRAIIRREIESSEVIATLYPTRIQEIDATTGKFLASSNPESLPFKFPKKPFRVPRYIPQTTLGGTRCPTQKCTNHNIVEKVVKSFNEKYSDRQIQKVIKGITPKEGRCDYEVQMLRTFPDGKTSIQTETLAVIMQESPANSCEFRYLSDTSDIPNRGSFIVNWAKDVYGYDIEGGLQNFANRLYALEGEEPGTIPYFTGLVNTFKDAYTRLVDVVASATTRQDTDIKVPLEETNKAYLEIEARVGSSTGFSGCPNVFCKDVGILQEMKSQYEAYNSASPVAGGAQKRMTRLLKTVQSGTNKCQLLYEVRTDQYTDLLSSPVDSDSRLETSEFQFTNIGGCRFKIMNKNDITKVDVPNPAFTKPESAIIQSTPSAQCPPMNCRDPALLNDIKNKLQAKWAPNTKKIQTLKSITASLQTEQFICEYKATKDVIEERLTNEAGIETNLKVTVEQNVSGSSCTYSAKSVEEFDPDEIDYVFDLKTLEQTPYKNGQRISLPILFNLNLSSPPANLNPDIRLDAKLFT